MANAPASARDASSLPWSAAPSTALVSESRTFRSGDATLAGTLYLPEGGQALAAVVVTHSASKPLRDAALYRHLTEMLPPLGIAVLTYDRRGSGRSGGSLKDSDYAMLADDAIAAVRMLKADPRIDPKRIGVWGLSQGGWLSLLAAARSPDVRFVVSISAPVVTSDVQMMFRSENSMRINGYSDAEIHQMRAMRLAVDDYMRGTGDRAVAQALVDAAKDEPWFDLLYMGKTVGDRATSRWRKEIEYDPLPTLDQVDVPALILFGGNDPVVPVATSVARIDARRAPSLTVRVIAGADHHMATSMTPKAQMDPAQSQWARPEAAEYFVILASWMTDRAIANVPK
nr:alpha/beta hydrolase [Altererythrobacter sp. C41]